MLLCLQELLLSISAQNGSDFEWEMLHTLHTAKPAIPTDHNTIISIQKLIPLVG